MSTELNIAIAAEFELCEKLADALAQSDLAVTNVSIVEIYPFTEEQSVRFQNKSVAQIDLEEADWSTFNYLLFAGDIQNASLVAQAAQQDCVVIDLKGICSALPDVPVVVPTINESDLIDLRQRNIVCLPDPQVSQLLLAIYPFLGDAVQPSISITSLLPASYMNSETVGKLAGQTAQLLNGIPLDDEQQRFAFDVFPALNAQNLELQIQRVFPQLENISIHPIQVPVFYGMGQMVTLKNSCELDFDEAICLWQDNAYVDYQADKLITPVTNGETEGELPMLHISQMTKIENGVQFWSVADEQQFNIARLGVKLLEVVYQNGY